MSLTYVEPHVWSSSESHAEDPGGEVTLTLISHDVMLRTPVAKSP